MNQQIDMHKLDIYLSREIEHMKDEIEQLCIFIKEGVKQKFFIEFVRAVARREGERPSFNVYKEYSNMKEKTTSFQHTEVVFDRLPPLNCLGEFGSYRYLLGVAEKVINHFMDDIPFTVLSHYDPSEWTPADSKGVSVHKRWPALYKRPGTERFFIKDGVDSYHPDKYMENWELFHTGDKEVIFPVIPACGKVERLFGHCQNPLIISRNSKDYFDDNFLNYYLEKTFLVFGDMMVYDYTFKDETLKAGVDLFVKEFIINDYPKLPERRDIRLTVTRIFKETKEVEDYEALYVAIAIYKALSHLLKSVPAGSQYIRNPDYSIHNLSLADFGGKKVLVTTEDGRTIAIGTFTEKDNRSEGRRGGQEC